MRHHTTAKSFTQIVLLSHLSMFCEAVSLARLVKAEIVYPLYGILINTDVDNPPAPFITALGRQASFTRLVGTHNHIRPYKGIRIHPFTYAFFLFCLSISCVLELQRPSPHFPPQPSPAMSGAGGKWMVSSITEGHVKRLRKAGYLSKDIAHRIP